MDDIIDKELAERIKECRMLSGMTQEQIADKLEISANAYSKIENGEIKVRAQTLLDMAFYFKVDTEYLFTGKYSKNHVLYKSHSEKTTKMLVTSKEKLIINMLRDLNQKDSEIVIAVLDALHVKNKYQIIT